MELWCKGGHGPYMFVDSEETNLTKAKNGRLEYKIGEVAWRGAEGLDYRACEVQTEDLRFGGVGKTVSY